MGDEPVALAERYYLTQIEGVSVLAVEEMDVCVEGEAGGVMAERAGELHDVGAASHRIG